MSISWIGFAIALLSLAIWIGLIGFRGQFWRSQPRLEVPPDVPNLPTYPAVCAIVPARNEAEVLPVSLRTLLAQNYPGCFTVILVDDHSTDGTGAIAQQVAVETGQTARLQVLQAQPLPAGWTGKLWAMQQGVQHAISQFSPDYILFTDADIAHDPDGLQRLAVKAEQDQLDLASVMVALRCQSLWERLLIPAFVFFFQKLYPFPLVNRPEQAIAAAAGGCILVRRSALEQSGGLPRIKQALIDDCSLAQIIKPTGSGRIWLGHSLLTRSLRPYPTLHSIWSMVARTAFTQLDYSWLQLLGTLVGMTLIYVVPPAGVLLGGVMGNWWISVIGLVTWCLMSLVYLPTLRLYRCSPGLAVLLPAIAFLYTLMTLDSALRHWRGQGGNWKGRTY